MERRNSVRLALSCKVREKNGDYLFTLQAANLSADGLFLTGKLLSSDNAPLSHLSFTLPNGVHLSNLSARIVRETRKGEPKGCAFEFMNLSEEARMELLRCLSAQAAS